MRDVDVVHGPQQIGPVALQKLPSLERGASYFRRADRAEGLEDQQINILYDGWVRPRAMIAGGDQPS